MTYRSIPDLFFQSCDKYNRPDAILTRTDNAYKPISHRFFRQRVAHFGRGLMAIGISQGTHVALSSETRFEWAVADLGILCVGAVTVPVYPTLIGDQYQHVIENSESSAIIVSNAAQLEKILSIKDRIENLGQVIVMDAPDELPAGVMSFEEVESLGASTDNESEFENRWQQQRRDQLLSLIYTSGTTGKSKGVMLTQENMLANIEGVMDAVPFSEGDIALSHLPLSHVFERMGGYYLLIACGVTIAYAESIQEVRKNLLEVRPTVMVSVPRLFEKIYAGIAEKTERAGFVKRKLAGWALGVASRATPLLVQNKPLTGILGFKYNLADRLVFGKIREATGGRLKFLISGGAPLQKEIGEFFLGIGIKILEGYGLTETSPVLCVNRPEKIKPGTVGPAIPNVEIKIAADGEILARGPNIMQGYYKNPDATKEVIVDGWFHTGDIGELDEDGYLRITDRKKDIIVTSGGKNVAPQPIENTLKLSPFIEQAVLIGDKRKFISALIVPPWETVANWAPLNSWPTDIENLINHDGFRKRLTSEIESYMKDFARYERVKKFEILPELLSEEKGELTPSLKIKRKVVASNYQTVIDSMYDMPK